LKLTVSYLKNLLACKKGLYLSVAKGSSGAWWGQGIYDDFCVCMMPKVGILDIWYNVINNTAGY